jgi:hypothetical protein
MSNSLIKNLKISWGELAFNIYEREPYGKKKFNYFSTNYLSFPHCKCLGFTLAPLIKK